MDQVNNHPTAKKIILTECPRDAMQGIPSFIPTKEKVKYLNLLLQVGFDVLDFGSFVSPKAIPQMADTKDILPQLEINNHTQLLAIIANIRGAQEASQYDEISFIGYPFSISETFQKRNTNTDIESSLNIVEEIIRISNKSNKIPIIYLSMAFGNPYGDVWNAEVTSYWTNELVKRGTRIIALADTTGSASPESIKTIYHTLSTEFSKVEFGLHLHSKPDDFLEKVDAGFNAGCRRFDAALKGFGGCPMASDELTGNIPTERLINYFTSKGIDLPLNKDALENALNFSSRIFH